MCGIFYLSVPKQNITAETLETAIELLFRGASERGKDSCGMVVISDDTQIFKEAGSYKNLLRKNKIKSLIRAKMQDAQFDTISIIGQSRMVTNGLHDLEQSQPLLDNNIVTVHNGIATNEMTLREAAGIDLEQVVVDTQVLSTSLAGITRKQPFRNAFETLIGTVHGANNLICTSIETQEMNMGTTHGSLYYARNAQTSLFVAASEDRIIEATRATLGLDGAPVHLEPRSMLHYRIGSEPEVCAFQYCPPQSRDSRVPPTVQTGSSRTIASVIEDNFKEIEGIRRCSKCILPETVPYIRFDEEGVCSYCQNHKPIPKLSYAEGVQRIGAALEGKKVLIPLSGGRDSCFAMHVVCKELGITPTTYTYDWGMVTDLARRNISRMCGDLGVEQILVSADIATKHANIRKNIKAWLKTPKLGLVPLFMAGDKQYFDYMNKVKKALGTDISLLASNPLEKTDFKSGFCGIDPWKRDANLYFDLDLGSQLTMLRFYGTSFLRNPSFLNSSLLDTLDAFKSYYLIDKDFISIFDYVNWNEQDVEDVILNQYDWEVSPDTDCTWRIGDATAPFYNYIYLTVAGFTENDTLRSNQVREGHITREEAMARVMRDNVHRVESLAWYLDTLDLDSAEVLQRINQIPKMYRAR